MPRRFSDDLRAAAAELWEQQYQHPFIRGIADGSLSLERFAHFMRQDYVFLIEYARMLALGAARARDLPTMRRYAELAQVTLTEEMELHRAFARDVGISEGELEGERPARTTQAYTDFLVRTAAIGEAPVLAAALLPCMWGYSELGRRLQAEGAPDHPHYARWIETYAAPEFAELAAWCRAHVDALGEAGDRARMTDAFLTCSRYELAFWDMAWKLEGWPAG